MARWLTAGTRVLLLDDPTRGVDVGASARRSTALAPAGGAAAAPSLLVSSDAEELVEVCDRILVMRHGRIGGECQGPEATEDDLLSAAAA